MTPVECAACGNQVLCEKFSMAHTSVQWTADASAVCAEYQDPMRTCAALRDSIDRAVGDGRLAVADA
ncbi:MULTISPECIES: hypothetical protein [unclassified Streptomyces]|uniref:hypothetical protein n=1 Tax=unclassified Streptomyces TaxID=2593676 RepID=UPI0013C26C25|nr:hypothetical protein [Streptomyces sp. SID10853]NDZ78096.1 hypothetical protein [Streptomyces sp. SID10853]WSU46199.1 hypothetical protein OG510_35885 [Streptomyces sp. NBC_01089]